MKRLKHLAVSAAVLGVLVLATGCADSTAPDKYWYPDDPQELVDQADKATPDDQNDDVTPARKDREDPKDADPRH